MNKILVTIFVVNIEEQYDVFLPKTKNIGNTILLVVDAIHQLSNNSLPIDKEYCLINKRTGQYYKKKEMILETDIETGTELLLL